MELVFGGPNSAAKIPLVGKGGLQAGGKKRDGLETERISPVRQP